MARCILRTEVFVSQTMCTLHSYKTIWKKLLIKTWKITKYLSFCGNSLRIINAKPVYSKPKKTYQ